MSKPILFMFSGQGSQYSLMGQELFLHHPVFRKWMLTLNDIVSEIIGESVLDHLYDDKKRKKGIFDRIRYTHPSIFMVEYSLAQVLLENGIEPDYVLGASMGEFASAALAGVMGVDELLKSVVMQAECFEKYCEAGGMLAIIHDTRLYDELPLLYENSELASVNYGSHFVVSGKPAGLKRIGEFLQSKNILCHPLPVSYAFHSSCIDPAASTYEDFLSHTSQQPPRIPFISCRYGALIKKMPETYFWDVVRKPIQFREAMRTSEDGDGHGHVYLDLGPSGTLANFVKRNLHKDSLSESYAIITPFHQELKNLENIKRLCARKTTR